VRHLHAYKYSANDALTPLDHQSFGTRLFETVFADKVGDCLRVSLELAKAQDQGLRIRLRLTDVPELADLPWEYLYAPDLKRFLALSDETVLVRYLELAQPPAAVHVTPPLTLLGIVSHPSDVPPLNVEEEWQRLQKALTGLQARHLVTLERLPTATLCALQDRLRQGDVHLLHYIGHGYFDVNANKGGLVLEDERGQKREVKASELGVLLHDHATLRLIFLNACEGARSGRDDAFAGVAQQLVEQGIPAVLAMQFEVTDATAITLAQEFYEAVADGYPADTSLAQARKAVFLLESAQPGEWGTPVLFSRAPDNVILTLPQGDACPVIEHKSWEPETILISAGPFWMGSQPGKDIPEYETPQHPVTLPDYRIGKTPVTNRQYAEFIRNTSRLIPDEALWNGQNPPRDRLDQALTGVSFYDAIAYCTWLGSQTGRHYSLPDEAEWEKAASSATDRGFTWGEVCEWTCSLWGEKSRRPDPPFAYPWQQDGRNDVTVGKHLRRVVRGAVATPKQTEQRYSARGGYPPDQPGPPGNRHGFRVVMKTTA
jgi:formylglycine-generating enzyme required for sulfatase activity